MSLISRSKSSDVMLSLMLPMTYIKVSCQLGELSQSSRVNIGKEGDSFMKDFSLHSNKTPTPVCNIKVELFQVMTL